jgi:putative tryptophan/tyrosine transport system substrate-binding protein
MRLDVNRRELIMFVSAATVWPLKAARAQQSENLARIGFLPLGSPSNQHDLSYVEAFRKGLIENGLIEGRNIILDVVWVANDSEYDQAAIELVRRGATLLVPVASSASAACKRQTSTIPIVFINVGNPVGIGIVESLSHPGGNVTGFADLTVELSGKLLEFARELTAAGKPIGYLWYDKWVDGQSRLLATEQAAKASGMALQARAISDVVELNSVVADLKSNGIKAVILQPGGFTWRHRQQIIEVMNRSTLAMICAWPPVAAEGALIGYGTDYPDLYRRASSYVSRVLKGEKPAELPVQNPTKFRLVINLNAAKVLGLQIPTNLLATADEVIE